MIELKTSTSVMKGAPYIGKVEFLFSIDESDRLESMVTAKFTYGDKTFQLHTFSIDNGNYSVASYDWKYKNQSYETMMRSNREVLAPQVEEKILNYMGSEAFLNLIRRRVRNAAASLSKAIGNI